MGRVCLLLVPLTAKQVRFDDQTGLSASKWGVVPDLDLLASFPHDLHHENDVSGMVPGGLNGRVPVPPEKRFLIHLTILLLFGGLKQILQKLFNRYLNFVDCSFAIFV